MFWVMEETLTNAERLKKFLKDSLGWFVVMVFLI